MATDLYQIIKLPRRYAQSADKTIIASDVDLKAAIASLLIEAGYAQKIDDMFFLLENDTAKAALPMEEKSTLQKITGAINPFG